MSRKSERLVNLTIALLASKRFITKSEIFRTVDGYDGEIEARERMFERDKEELRSLGIEIEVGSFDPLFEDEPGYRIVEEKYSIQLGDLSPIEYSLLLLAAQQWRDGALSEQSLGALIKLKALGIDSDFESLPNSVPSIGAIPTHLPQILDAIAEKRTLLFDYLSSEGVSEPRTINPYGVVSQRGHWYLAGHDSLKKQLRVFRLDRITSEVSTHGKASSYEIPDSFSINEILLEQPLEVEARLKVRVGKAHSMRAAASSSQSLGTWDEITVPFRDMNHLVDSVLWHGDDVVLLEPTKGVELVKDSLKRLIELHG